MNTPDRSLRKANEWVLNNLTTDWERQSVDDGWKETFWVSEEEKNYKESKNVLFDWNTTEYITLWWCMGL